MSKDMSLNIALRQNRNKPQSLLTALSHTTSFTVVGSKATQLCHISTDLKTKLPKPQRGVGALRDPANT